MLVIWDTMMLMKRHYDVLPLLVLCNMLYSVMMNYCQTYNISHTLLGKKIIDHSDVVGASPVGAAPTTSSFLT